MSVNRPMMPHAKDAKHATEERARAPFASGLFGVHASACPQSPDTLKGGHRTMRASSPHPSPPFRMEEGVPAGRERRRHGAGQPHRRRNPAWTQPLCVLRALDVRIVRSAAILALALLADVARVQALEPPAVTELRRDEELILFPALAYPQADGGWAGEVRALVFERQSRPLILPAVERVVGLVGRDLTSSESAIFTERARWLMMDHERGKRVVVRIGRETFDLGRTDELGQVTGAVKLPGTGAGEAGRVLSVEASLPREEQRRFTGRLELLSATGLSVVSDIDDTIKVSVVTNKQELLKNTFTRPFRAVPGMAALYRGWREQHGAAFHYVSASPWQLYAPLAEFARSNAFPAGSFHLKTFRWRDETFLNLFGSPEEYKIATIEPLLRAAPQRRFVLVGDSGERDPEAYGELARRHPQQVIAIFIRELAGETASAPRYQRAFREIPSERWRVFGNPAQLQETLKDQATGRN
jgi:phosphatidate phosphatase APP1